MEMNTSRKLIIALAILLGGTIVFVTQGPQPETIVQNLPRPQAMQEAGTQETQPATDEEIKEGTGFTAEQSLATYFKNRYGDRIKKASAQILMLDEMKVLLHKRYPDAWKEKLREIIKLAFPDMATELLARFDAVQQYEDWQLSNNSSKDIDPKDKRRSEWDKRIELFGEEAAHQIWEDQYKGEQMEARLNTIAESQRSFGDKTQDYVSALKDVYGSDAFERVEPMDRMGNFYMLKSVQQDLASMPRDQRTAELRNFRKAIGLDDESIERLEALDQQRDQNHDLGMSYMTQRKALESQLSGAELLEEAYKLQKKVFGEAQAEFIHNEEQSGYYRFKEPQIIGVN